jgi:hypothetical protein
MIAQTKSLNQISKEAIFTLSHKIGTADTVRFLNQFTIGLGDYTEERQDFIGNMNLDETVSEIKKMKESLLNKKIHPKRKKTTMPFSRHTRSSLKTKIN